MPLRMQLHSGYGGIDRPHRCRPLSSQNFGDFLEPGMQLNMRLPGLPQHHDFQPVPMNMHCDLVPIPMRLWS